MQPRKSKCSPGNSSAISILCFLFTFQFCYIYSLIGLVWTTVQHCVCLLSAQVQHVLLLRSLAPVSALSCQLLLSFFSLNTSPRTWRARLLCAIITHTHTVCETMCGCCLAAGFAFFLRLCGCLVTLHRCVARCDTAANCESQLVSADCSPNSYINFRIFFVHCLCAVKCAVFH